MADLNTQSTRENQPDKDAPAWYTTLKVGGFAVAALAFFEICASMGHHTSTLDVPSDTGLSASMKWRSTGHRKEQIAEILGLRFNKPGSYEIEVSKVSQNISVLAPATFSTNSLFSRTFTVNDSAHTQTTSIPMGDYYLFGGTGFLNVKFTAAGGEKVIQSQIGL